MQWFRMEAETPQIASLGLSWMCGDDVLPDPSFTRATDKSGMMDESEGVKTGTSKIIEN